MCGRLTHTLTPEDYATYVDLVVPALEPNQDVRPTDTLPIVRMGERGLEYALAKWGFPSACTTRSSKVLFNARSETVAELPSFREAYRRRRALLFVSGWYEWKEGQRFLIRRKDGKPVVMAALWEGDRFTVLTCGAGEDLAWLHHRVPVVLERRNWMGWLKGQTLQAWLQPFPRGPLVAELFLLKTGAIQHQTELLERASHSVSRQYSPQGKLKV
jgi:putative SOS response-associated peptidase YedK